MSSSDISSDQQVGFSAIRWQEPPLSTQVTSRYLNIPIYPKPFD